MSDTQGSSNNGERDAEDLNSAHETGAPSVGNDAPQAAAPEVPEAEAPKNADPVIDEGAPLDDAPSEFLADDESGENEVDYEALAAELDRLEAETAAAAPVSPSQPEPEPTANEHAADAQVAPASAPVEEPTAKPDPWFEPAKTEVFAASAAAVAPVGEAVPAPVPPAAAPTAVEETVAPSPIFVQAPEPPRKRGNRAATGLIGLVAALVFAALYGAALYGWQVFVSLVPAMNIAPALDPMDFVNDVLLSGPYWVTVVAFWLAFWLLGVFVNRARWWSWVVLGLFVSLLTYVGFLGGVLFEAPFWEITGSQALEVLRGTVFAAPGLIAFILAREVTIWFGGWVSRRGAKITVQNKEARDEYERVMAEGPSASA